MSNVAEQWLRSGKAASIEGMKLRPLEFPGLKGTLLAPQGGQAQAFYLQDENKLDWILKKFLPGKIPDGRYMNAVASLIPHRPGFQSGYLRRILSSLSVSRGGFFHPEFASWIDRTVLMSRIKFGDWQELADKIRQGTVMPSREARLSWCKALSEQIGVLEGHQISHRDLSVKNVFVDVQNSLTHLIDWDCIFHPSLSMPVNTALGTEGYLAPFVKNSSGENLHATWVPRADRFALAILNTEFLSMNVGSVFKHDGGMFEQSELSQRGGPETAAVVNILKNDFPDAAQLLERALKARTFDDCPGPNEWQTMASLAKSPSARATVAPAQGTASAQPAVPPASSLNSFSILDESAFVELNQSVFASLIN